MKEKIPETWIYPYMILENDNTFNQQYLKKIFRSKIPRIDAQKENPWHSLYCTPTYNSWRRFHLNTQENIHKDHLDHALNSIYDQTKEWNADIATTLKQKVSEEMKSGSRPCVPQEQTVLRPTTFGHPLYISEATERIRDFNNIALAIECPHISQTNNGYTRKTENGTFYRS